MSSAQDFHDLPRQGDVPQVPDEESLENRVSGGYQDTGGARLLAQKEDRKGYPKPAVHQDGEGNRVSVWGKGVMIVQRDE